MKQFTEKSTYQKPSGFWAPSSLSNDAEREDIGLTFEFDGANAMTEPTKAARTTANFMVICLYGLGKSEGGGNLNQCILCELGILQDSPSTLRICVSFCRTIYANIVPIGTQELC
jgi:hypothetical protein